MGSFRGVSKYNSSMACAQHERLVAEYVALLRQNINAGDAVQDKNSEEWRTATEATRKACEVALGALSHHRVVHDCSATQKSRPSHVAQFAHGEIRLHARAGRATSIYPPAQRNGSRTITERLA